MGTYAKSPSPVERIAGYRALASEAFQLSSATKDEQEKLGYLDMAARWNALADELDLFMDRPNDAPKSIGKTAPRGPRANRG